PSLRERRRAHRPLHAFPTRRSSDLGMRKGRMTDMQPLGSGRTRVKYRVPARGLIGFRNEFLTVTRGEGILSSESDGWEPWQGPIDRKSTRLNSSHVKISYAVFCLKK